MVIMDVTKETFQSVGVSRAAGYSSRATYYSSIAFFNPFMFPQPSKTFTCFSYNKPFNGAYKRGNSVGSVGTISSSSMAKRSRV